MGRAETAQLHRDIRDAIERRSLVMFEYNNLIRVVEPHRFGVNSAGHVMLSGWLRAGYSRSDPAGGWRNWLLTDIRAFQLLDAPFAGARPGYAARDERMREVYAELAPAGGDAPAEGPYVVREPRRATDPVPPAVEAQAARAAAAGTDATMSHDGELDPPDAMP